MLTLDGFVLLAFNVAMEQFKRKTDRMAQVAYPVIKQVYETQGHMYENILIPITDGKRMYNISCSLKAAYDSECKEVVKAFEKSILLHVIDEAWKENLRELDELKHSVQNASYEQKDPLLIYKLESVNLFDTMVDKINNQTVSILMRGQIPVQEPQEIQQAAPEQKQDMSKYREQKQDLSDPNQQAAAQQDTREQVKREPIRAGKDGRTLHQLRSLQNSLLTAGQVLRSNASWNDPGRVHIRFPLPSHPCRPLLQSQATVYRFRYLKRTSRPYSGMCQSGSLSGIRCRDV